METNCDWVSVRHLLSPGWKVKKIWHLPPQENRGKHNIFVNIYKDGIDFRNPNFVIKSGWNGQHPDESSKDAKFDKPKNEPGADVPIEKGQEIWIKIWDGGSDSEVVMNLKANFEDNSGEGNSLHHHSYLVEFEYRQGDIEILPVVINPSIVENPDMLEAITQMTNLAHQILTIGQKFVL